MKEYALQIKFWKNMKEQRKIYQTSNIVRVKVDLYLVPDIVKVKIG